VAAESGPSKKPKSVKPSRAGLKQISTYQVPEVLKQLKILAAEQDTPVEALIGQGLNLLFAKYHKPPIAKG
jgi:hypothetical protein